MNEKNDKCYYCDEEIIKDNDKINFDEEGNLYHSKCLAEKNDIEMHLSGGIRHFRVSLNTNSCRAFFKANDLILTRMFRKCSSSISIEYLKKEIQKEINISEKEIFESIDFLKEIGILNTKDDILFFPFQDKDVFMLDFSSVNKSDFNEIKC